MRLIGPPIGPACRVPSFSPGNCTPGPHGRQLCACLSRAKLRLLDVSVKQAEDERPAVVARAQIFGIEARVGDANFGGSVVLIEFPADESLDSIFVADPGEGEQARTVDLAILAGDPGRFAGLAVALDHYFPAASGPEFALDVSGLELAFDSPPVQKFGGVGESLEDAFCRSIDRDLLNDRVAVYDCHIHFVSSMYFL